MPDEAHPADRSSTWGLVDFTAAPEVTDAEDALRKPEAKHFRLRELRSIPSRKNLRVLIGIVQNSRKERPHSSARSSSRSNSMH